VRSRWPARVLRQVRCRFGRNRVARQRSEHYRLTTHVGGHGELVIAQHHPRDLAALLEHHPAPFLLAHLGDAPADPGRRGGTRLQRLDGLRQGHRFTRREGFAVDHGIARHCGDGTQQEHQQDRRSHGTGCSGSIERSYRGRDAAAGMRARRRAGNGMFTAAVA
jgi:hypothetical protein